MRRHTLLDSMRSLRKLRISTIEVSLRNYTWEIAFLIILFEISFIFDFLLSFKLAFVLLGYFWCWALSSPRLIYRAGSKNYKLSLIKGIIKFERSLRGTNFFKSVKMPYLRPASRIISLALFSILFCVIIKRFYFLYFLGGAIFYEVALLIKVQTRQ
ncbi:MAG: hypothetical protein ACPGJV_05760 [Bacteriovoracaceae bacterium]